MAADLDQATRVLGGDGRFSATLSDQWEIWGPNGGYLAAIALRAAGEMARIQRPRSFYCHFLSSPAFAPVELEVALLKRGSRAESLSVGMTQQGKPILQAFVKTASDGPGHTHQHPDIPEVPPPERVEAFEYVPLPGVPGFAFGRTWSGDGSHPRPPRTALRYCESGRGFARLPVSKTRLLTRPAL